MPTGRAPLWRLTSAPPRAGPARRLPVGNALANIKGASSCATTTAERRLVETAKAVRTQPGGKLGEDHRTWLLRQYIERTKSALADFQRQEVRRTKRSVATITRR